LLPHESCTLASVNLALLVADGRTDWARLDRTVALAVRFLDDVLEVNRYPTDALERAARASRKIGLGVMGLAEMLAALGIPYDSDTAVRFAGRLAARIRDGAYRASAQLARERGAFPLFGQSALAGRVHAVPLRNAALTSIAPTGTISLIAGTTSGIEPMFAVSYVRNVLGRQLLERNALFERVARDRGFWSEELVIRLGRTGRLRESPDVPEDVRRSFVTALEIAPSWQLRVQVAFQRHVDAAVSKTVNLPADAPPADVREIFLLAWRLGAKGVTVYRDGSRPGQVLTTAADGGGIRVDTAYTGGCAGRACEL
jgi:ribonucleoside-diphosphate reductase alpha chain